MAEGQIAVDDLDEKLLDHLKGYVVKKDLVREIKSGENVPVFVLEYLLADACSTTDKQEIRRGLDNVKSILRKNYVDPERSEKVKADVRNRGSLTIIDRIEAKLDTKHDLFWGSLTNSNIKDANVDEEHVEEHEKMLTGGVWSIIDLGYDASRKVGSKRHPFVVENLKPIQLSRFPEEKVEKVRSDFTKDEWKNVLLRSVGLEPTAEDIDERMILLLLSRLIPLVESNFNMIELGPRSTGKSFTFRELSPYGILLSGGQATVAQLFINLNTKEIGLVGMWDTVAFDEVAGIKFKQKDALQIMKDYMESGSFSRGGSGELTGKASMVFNGNINQSVETALKTSHLFDPLPEDMQDTALLDRIHFYLPGWEAVKYKNRHFTTHFGMSMDFFSEYLHHLRDLNYTDIIKDYFDIGSSLNHRDERAVRKTVSGFLKLIHPAGNFDKQDVKEYIEIGMEMRRRVKEQLKRIGGMEFWDTNFSYIDKDSREEKYVNVPEEKSSAIIESQPLKPGLVYTVSSNSTGQTLLRLECTATEGKGKITVTGTNNKAVRDDIKNSYTYLRSNEQKFLPQSRSLDNYDVTIDLHSLIGSELGPNLGAAALLVIITAVHKKNLKSGLGVIGDITVGGGLSRVDNFPDTVALLSENGAKHVLAPTENVDDIGKVPREVHADTNTIFYDSAQTLLQKAIVES